MSRESCAYCCRSGCCYDSGSSYEHRFFLECFRFRLVGCGGGGIVIPFQRCHKVLVIVVATVLTAIAILRFDQQPPPQTLTPHRVISRPHKACTTKLWTVKLPKFQIAWYVSMF